MGHDFARLFVFFNDQLSSFKLYLTCGRDVNFSSDMIVMHEGSVLIEMRDDVA